MIRAFETISDRIFFDLLPLAVRIFIVVTVLTMWHPLLGGIVALWTMFYLIASYFFALYKLKFDVRAVEEADATRELRARAQGLRLIVAGSTLDGEESALIAVWPQLLKVDSKLTMILAPRHPERFASVAALLADSGIPWVRRTDWPSALAPGQIVLLDIVFSLDSVITAVGMAQQVTVMVAAIICAVLVMMLFANAVCNFVNRYPTIRMLALAFLLLVGMVLIAEGAGKHIERGYIYFAMAFSLGVELLNLRFGGRPAAHSPKK